MADNQQDKEKITTDQYGRKKWNLEVYAAEARNKKRQGETPAGTAHQIQDDSSSLEYISQRNKLLDQLLSAVKKYNLISPESSTTTTTYGKNKRFGFFCPICDLSFRDNLLLIDHLNSPQHISKLNQLNASKDGTQNEELLEGGIRRASLKEVVSTVERLVAKSIQEKNRLDNTQSGQSFAERVEKRREFEEKRKQKRHERKNVQKQRKKLKGEQAPDAASDDIANLMGFGSFGSTKT
ncbi:U4/U6.U5 small nuclear ribonucleoprotein component snu23 [Candida viswanathii]|uniref:U4/U6.U5 small nuclear ribonucleoprotein component snu23 n=1 Tax=Candida viswanathii TaxID=5486 RepID=A0A367XP79_9ASCO|nr:U4/U6.U5 small nuclear ribonucleoprotein component snu23 [Candida viswanathii]